MRFFLLSISVILASAFANTANATERLPVLTDAETTSDLTLISLNSEDTLRMNDCGYDTCKPRFRLKTRVFLENVWSSDYAGAVPQTLERTRFGANDTRLGFEGWLRDNVFYRAEMGFVRDDQGGFTFVDDVELGDLYLELAETAIGNVRVGHFIEPFSLERQSRKELIPFMERSVATRNFAPGRNLGFMVYDHMPSNENLSWYLGAFMGNQRDDFSVSTSDDWAATGRVAWLPFYNECCHNLLHVGLGATARRTGNSRAVDGNGRWMGNVPLGDLRSLINTTLAPDTEFNVYNLELAWAKGPLPAQAEAYYTETNSLNRIYMSGLYAQVSLFVTGEHREYDRTMKAFGRVYPLHPVLGACDRGLGTGNLLHDTAIPT